MRRILLAAILLGSSVAACGGDVDQATEPGAGSVDVASSPSPEATPLGPPDVVLKVKTLSGKRFVPEELHAPAGAVVKIVYTNLSGLPHQFKIFKGSHPGAPMLGATRTGDEPKPRSIVFAVPEEPGRYLFFCPILGHGFVMRGFLIGK